MNSATQSFLGRYRLVKVLGQGAMGVVYEAVDTRLGRTVAIKTVLRSHMADEHSAAEYASRFEREAQAAARLSHPHVVTVYDFGEHEDISYIVMEFVRGRELNQIFEAGEKFSLSESIRMMCELLQALDYAHQQGVVHRDVKPANVLIDGTGRVKLTDFGVARVTNAGQDRTMPGTLVGTPSYMSPEQILGLAVGSRADIFAAGVILYQFLTGKRPFSGGGPFGVQRKIVQDDPEPPSQLNPELPPGFDSIISRALAKQPENRYENAAIFAADLERIAASLPRDLPLIDLDFTSEPTHSRPFTATPSRPATNTPAPPTATRPAPTPALTPTPAPTPQSIMPAPQARAAPPPADPLGITLLTDIPFGGPPAPSPAPKDAPPPFDPDTTVIMARPSVPHGGGGAPSAAQRSLPLPPAPTPLTRPPTVSSPPAPSQAAGTVSGRTSATTARPQAAAPAAGAPTGRPAAPAPTAPAAAREPTVTPARTAVPVAHATLAAAVSNPRVALAPVPMPVPAQHSAARAATTPRRRNPLLPMAAGAGVAAVALGLFLALGKPGLRKSDTEGYAQLPAAASTPALGASSPGPGTASAAAAPAPAAVPAAAAASVATGPVTPSVPETPAVPDTTTPPAATASDPTATATTRPPRPPPAHQQGTRKPPLDPGKGAARNDGRGNGLEPRCADLLQRMQLGEPLSPEQTSFFQTRCTR